MKTINIKNELEKWLIDYITEYIHQLEAEDVPENEAFNRWAKSFEREEAETLVGMEFVNDWFYDKRTEVNEKEAVEYAQSLIKEILDNWYL